MRFGWLRSPSPLRLAPLATRLSRELANSRNGQVQRAGEFDLRTFPRERASKVV